MFFHENRDLEYFVKKQAKIFESAVSDMPRELCVTETILSRRDFILYFPKLFIFTVVYCHVCMEIFSAFKTYLRQWIDICCIGICTLLIILFLPNNHISFFHNISYLQTLSKWYTDYKILVLIGIWTQNFTVALQCEKGTLLIF